MRCVFVGPNLVGWAEKRGPQPTRKIFRCEQPHVTARCQVDSFFLAWNDRVEGMALLELPHEVLEERVVAYLDVAEVVALGKTSRGMWERLLGGEENQAWVRGLVGVWECVHRGWWDGARRVFRDDLAEYLEEDYASERWEVYRLVRDAIYGLLCREDGLGPREETECRLFVEEVLAMMGNTVGDDVLPELSNIGQCAFLKAASVGDAAFFLVQAWIDLPCTRFAAKADDALAAAVSAKGTKLTAFLLARPEVDPTCELNYPVCTAAGNGAVDILAQLLAIPQVDPTVDRNGPVRYAAHAGHAGVVELLLAEPDVDPGVEQGFALTWASYFGHLDVVAMLLADPRVDPRVGNSTALMGAIAQNRIEVVRLLLEDSRVDVGAQGGYALTAARATQNAELIALVEHAIAGVEE